MNTFRAGDGSGWFPETVSYKTTVLSRSSFNLVAGPVELGKKVSH